VQTGREGRTGNGGGHAKGSNRISEDAGVLAPTLASVLRQRRDRDGWRRRGRVGRGWRSERRKGEDQKTTAAQQTRGVVGRSNKAHNGGSGAAIAFGSTQTRRMGKWVPVAWLSTKARCGVFIRNNKTIRDKYSTSRKCELEGERERRTLRGTASNRLRGAVTIKAVSERLEILLNNCKVRNIEREGNEGEERRGDNRW